MNYIRPGIEIITTNQIIFAFLYFYIWNVFREN